MKRICPIIFFRLKIKIHRNNYQLRVRWPTVVSRILPVTQRIGQPQAVSVARISCSCWPGQATSSVVVHVSTANISQYPGRKHHLHNRETPCRAESRSSRPLHVEWHARMDRRKPRKIFVLRMWLSFFDCYLFLLIKKPLSSNIYWPRVVFDVFSSAAMTAMNGTRRTTTALRRAGTQHDHQPRKTGKK